MPGGIGMAQTGTLHRATGRGGGAEPGRFHRAAPGSTQHRQDLRRHHGQRRRIREGHAGRNPRAARRKRRRQIDPRQDHLRTDPAERRRNALAGREDGARPARRKRARSASAWCSSISRCSTISPWRKTSRSGSTASETFAAMSARLDEVSRVYGLPLDPNREVWRLVGRRAPAHRDRARADAESETPDPRRADRGADAAGGRPALHRARAAQGEGRAILYISHKLEEVKRLCDTATILRGGKKVVDLRSARGDRGVARAHDGGRRDRRSEGRRRARHHRAAAGHQRPHPRAGRPHGVRLNSISVELKGGEILGIAGVAGNGQDELFAALSGERPPSRAGTVVIDGHAAGAPLRHRAAPARRGLRSGGAARPRHRAAHEAVGERAADRPCRERHGPAAASSTSRRRWTTVDQTTGPSTCARPSAIRRPPASPAAICRNSSSAAKSCASRACWSSASRPGASMPAPPP